MQPSSGTTQPKKDYESRIVRCPNCGHHNPPGQKFCGACGNPLQAQSVPRESVTPSSVVQTRKQLKKKMSPTIIGAIITTIGAVLIALVSSPLVLGWWGSNAKTVSLTVQVADSSGTPIKNAKVTLFLPQGALVDYTDETGGGHFENVKSEGQQFADLIVESDQYETSNKEVSLLKDQTIEIRPSTRDPNNRTIFIRVVDDNKNTPVDGAKIELIVSGNNFVESTDTNGIGIFKVSFFSGDTVDADLTVNNSNYNINRQRVTLQSNIVQDVRLSTNQAVVGDVTVMQPTSVPLHSDTSGTISLAFGQNVSGSVDLPAELDKYTFTAKANNVILITISKTSGELCPEIQLFGPDATLLKDVDARNFCVTAEINITLPADGIYTVIVRDQRTSSGAATGKYNLTLQQIN